MFLTHNKRMKLVHVKMLIEVLCTHQRHFVCHLRVILANITEKKARNCLQQYYAVFHPGSYRQLIRDSSMDLIVLKSKLFLRLVENETIR